MNVIAGNLSVNVNKVEVLIINEKKLYETVKKRKRWSAPCIDGIQNVWWTGGVSPENH